MKHIFNDGDYDENEVEIVDLDLENSTPSNQQTISNHMPYNQLTRASRQASSGEASTPLKRSPHIWLRLSMAVLTLVGSLVLFFLLWPDIKPSLKLLVNKPIQATSAPISASPAISSLVFPADNVTYIFTTHTETHPFGNSLVAVNVHSGRQVWRYRASISGLPLLQDGLLYIPTTTGIDAFQADTQTLLWHQSSSKGIYALTAKNGVLYATSSQTNTIDAIRSSDGSLLWHLAAHEFVVQVTQNDIYTSSSAGALTILNARNVRDGSSLWHHEVLNNDLQVTENTVYTQQDAALVALRASNGSQVWRRTGLGNILAASDNLLIALSLDGTSVIALRASDGASIWHYNIQNVRQSQLSNSTLYLSTTNPGNNLLALNANDGSLLWQVQAPGILLSIDNGILCLDAPFQFPKGYIYALQASDGSMLWRQVKKENQSEQSWDGIIYATLPDGGKLAALRASDGATLWQYPLYA